MRKESERNVEHADTLKVFGENLRRFRTAAGMSQSDLAHAAGLHETWVSQLDRGEVSPTLPTICALASALGLPAAELVAGLPLDGA